MKRLILSMFILFTFFMTENCFAQSWIRVNLAGYLPQDTKCAVLLSLDKGASGKFEVFEVLTSKLVYSGEGKAVNAASWGMKSA
ncbi:MAG TPA: cellulase N-terminal Ig-like domain-containing protein, partial [Bacteroidales bacterium]|nr:cellulase N-terminal Ig-like domain-containing protein [Bacteroidales bacterium]